MTTLMEASAGVAAVTTAFTSAAGDVTDAITTMGPILMGVAVLGTVMGIGIKWIKKLRAGA